MEEAQAVELHILNNEDGEGINSATHTSTNDENQNRTELQPRNYMQWLKVAIYSIFILSGQTTATLLGRLYYSKGGQSKWIGTLVQIAAFPVLIPYYYLLCYSKKNPIPSSNDVNTPTKRRPSTILLLASVYSILGLLIAGASYLTSLGILYLPVSTFTLIFASQLAFTCVFSFFLNSQKFTPFIVNSVLLLTISSTLLVFGSGGPTAAAGASKRKYAIGFLCTVAASVGTGFLLAPTQFAFRKVLKVKTVGVVVEVIIYESLVATCIGMAGLFGSGEWKSLSKEMGEFELGKVSYFMTLAWTALSWEVYMIGSVGLIFEVSSLFCNVISALGLPLVQVLAVVTFHDKMDGLKVISLLLAIWGFVSYIYQHHLDENYGTSMTEGVQMENPNENL